MQFCFCTFIIVADQLCGAWLEPLEAFCNVRNCLFNWQTLHGACAEEAMHTFGPAQHIGSIFWRRNRSTVAEDQNVWADCDGSVANLLNEPDTLVESLARGGTNGATGCEAHVCDENVGAGGGHLLRLLDVEHVRRREEIHLVGGAHHVHLEIIRHARLLQVGTELAVNQADSRKVLHAGEAEVAQLAEEVVGVEERIRAANAGNHRRVVDDGQNFLGLMDCQLVHYSRETGVYGLSLDDGSTHHVEHNVVCVTIWHQSRERTATGHAKTTAIVNDYEVAAAGLDELGRETDTSASANNGLSLGDLPPQVAQDLLSIRRRRHDQYHKLEVVLGSPDQMEQDTRKSNGNASYPGDESEDE